MGVKSILIKPYAHFVAADISSRSKRAVEVQQTTLQRLINVGGETLFGRGHRFDEIKTHDDFKQRVRVRDYEGVKPYIERIIERERDILWPGVPLYFAKTSGTTSGTKYIPITRDSVSSHFISAQAALMMYIARTGKSRFMNGKMIFLSGSPELEEKGGIATGRLSGIVNHHIPAWLRSNQLPSNDTNRIEDWEEKVEKIVEETYNQNMTLISGIPPWVQMYFDKLVEKVGKPVKDIFPNLEMLVHGGVNYAPYKSKLEQTIGKPIPTVETYPASEGFIAFQDSQKEEGLLLNVDAGMFFEFVPADEIFNENPTRLGLGEVEIGVNYALIISSDAGLWAYNIGDTVRFVSLNPYRIVVSGRIKHYISAFGEHVIGEEVESALLDTAMAEGINITEFSVAPKIQVTDGLPYHEWLVEFGNMPPNLDEFARKVDEQMQKKNIYYADLIKGKVLRPLVIRPLQADAFRMYMKSQGKLGGQNKVPRLSNEREIADELQKFIIP